MRSFSKFLSKVPLIFLLVIASPPLIDSIYSSFFRAKFTDSRASLQVYENYDWSDTHFENLPKLSTKPHHYISYRRKDFASETINVENGMRHTLHPSSHASAEEFWFFGGSAVWGTGVNDENTIPSRFALKHDAIAYNFAETGYQARNSLGYFINLVATNIDADYSATSIFYFAGLGDVYLVAYRVIQGL